jgi:antitoxin HigA-1
MSFMLPDDEPPYAPDLLKAKMTEGQVDYEDLARLSGLTRDRVEDLETGGKRFTAEDALRLAKVFGIEPDYWLAAQMKRELFDAQAKLWKKLGAIKSIKDLAEEQRDEAHNKGQDGEEFNADED